MASSTSNDLKLELITTGEKSGTWGTITNTNLQILEQASSGYLSLAVGSADVALSLANYATSNGKNLYYKLTGTLTANRTVTMPDTAERVFIVEDATDRSSSLYTLTVKTVSGTGLVLPTGQRIDLATGDVVVKIGQTVIVTGEELALATDTVDVISWNPIIPGATGIWIPIDPDNP